MNNCLAARRWQADHGLTPDSMWKQTRVRKSQKDPLRSPSHGFSSNSLCQFLSKAHKMGYELDRRDSIEQIQWLR